MFLLLRKKSQVSAPVENWAMMPESKKFSGKPKLQLQSINTLDMSSCGMTHTLCFVILAFQCVAVVFSAGRNVLLNDFSPSGTEGQKRTRGFKADERQSNSNPNLLVIFDT